MYGLSLYLQTSLSTGFAQAQSLGLRGQGAALALLSPQPVLPELPLVLTTLAIVLSLVRTLAVGLFCILTRLRSFPPGTARVGVFSSVNQSEK